jgi:hypothetical protein
MELLAIAVYSFSTLGKGFDEVMPHNDNKFLVKTILLICVRLLAVYKSDIEADVLDELDGPLELIC